MKTSELKKMVALLKPAIKNNDIAEFGQFVFFTKDMMFVYNGAVAVIVKQENDGEFAVPAEEFVKFVDKLKADTTTIEIGDTIVIKSGRSKAEFTLNDTILQKAKNLGVLSNETYKKLPSDFLEALKLCQYSVSADNIYRNLSFVSIDGDTMASTDNYRISEFVMSEKMENVMIPANAIKYLLSYNVTEYSVNNGVAHFKNDDDVYFVTRLGQEEFPEYKAFLEVEGDTVELPANIIEMVETAAITTESIIDIDKSIVMEAMDGTLSISSQNDVGKILVDSEIDYKDEFRVVINPLFVKDILNITRNITVGENRVLFELKNFRHIVALLA